MASLDDIYDAVNALDKNDAEYLLIAIQKGKSQGKADIFYNLKNNDSLRVLSQALKIFSENIEKKQGEEGGESN